MANASSGHNRAKAEQQQIQPSTIPLEKRDSYLKFLRGLSAPHVDSFNFIVAEGLHLITEELDPVLVRGPVGPTGKSVVIQFRIHSLSLQKPKFNLSPTSSSSLSRPLYPMQCRLSGSNYIGDLFGAFTIVLDNKQNIEIPIQRIARIPVMVGSSACHLHEKSRDQLVIMGEEEYEFGGTFILNGTEKLTRMVLVPRPNHAISADRKRNGMRGPLFSDISLGYRSMRRDLSSQTLHFHFLRNGAVRVRLTIDGSEYFIPAGVLLRALLPAGTTDRDIYELITGGESDDTALCNSGIAIVQELSERYVYFRKRDTEPGVRPTVSRTAATAYLGKNFKGTIRLEDVGVTDLQAGTAFLRRFILTHLSVNPYEDHDDTLDRSKADLIVYLIRKLVATSTGSIEVDNPDALSHQSVMTSGHLYLNLLKDRISACLGVIAAHVRREAGKEGASEVDRSEGKPLVALVKEGIGKVIRGEIISKAMRYLLSTGNISPKTKLDLPQFTGYTIIAERINFLRFLSHFRAVHRGAFYAAMRSTKVRKLLPEAWGFICPVHTPDGEPCGILNHLSSDAIITHGGTADRGDLMGLLLEFNVTPAPALSAMGAVSPKGTIPVIVDGRVLGFVHPDSAPTLVDQLRYAKARTGVEVLSQTSEVALIMPIKEKAGFMPGIYVHTGGSRLMRPVKWLQMATKRYEKDSGDNGTKEWIGSLEQVFMRIRPAVANPISELSPVAAEGATHEEISSVSFLSVLAQLAPFPDMNQGPRNMFQCQMAKQTMGTPCHAIWNRMDAKTYRHTTPQVPITRNFCMQDPMGADLYPNGVNAVVAVISYSGNDMEDALIINKASIERGFAHGFVYVNSRVDLDDTIAGRDSEFVRMNRDEQEAEDTVVEEDGLPGVGARVKHGTKLYGKGSKHLKEGQHQTQWTKHKSVEEGTVDEVIVYDSDVYNSVRGLRGEGIREANVRIRIPRRPSVGDKFASRAGQKGTMSAAWPSEDMPFTETGMTPDILFNPNGFPSRMTIGMMVEIMSGKCGALHGRFNDSTPFQFDDDERAVDYFAEQLLQAGYQYSGNETLYSGYTGEPLQVEIFTGIVHYQRLRHMVSDKFQVRSTGSVHPLFRQPIKGRKRGGAIRFGEMERDGLLAHGASFLLRDRLGIASDLHVIHVCELCGSLITPVRRKNIGVDIMCMDCEADERKGCVRKVALPYSFKYLTNELAAMNIRTILKLKEVA